MLHAVRGATTVDHNEEEAIQGAVHELVGELLSQNDIEVSQILSVFFTVTQDLTALNPAKAIREKDARWQRVPMLCAQEPMMDEMLPLCIRVLIQWTAKQSMTVAPVYLGKTQQLRPDLCT